MIAGCAHQKSGPDQAERTDQRAHELARRAAEVDAQRAVEYAYWRGLGATLNAPEQVAERRQFLREHPVLSAVRERLSGLSCKQGLTAHRPVDTPYPEYPPALTGSTHHFGYLLMAIVIATDGSVAGLYRMPERDARLPPEFETVTLEALRTWRFEPVRCDGVAIESWALQVVKFSHFRSRLIHTGTDRPVLF